MGFINQFAGPIALGNIGYRYIYVFVGWGLLRGAGVVSFLVGLPSFPPAARWTLLTGLSSLRSVEAQGRTLEELEWVYSQPNPVRASLIVDKVVVQADGTVTEKIGVDTV